MSLMKNDQQSNTHHRTATRRAFLKSSATAAAATSLAGLDLSRFAHAAGNDVLRVGLIGCGGRNTGAGAQALKADRGARLVAACDFFLDRVKNARNAIRTEMDRIDRVDQVQLPDDHCFHGFAGYQRVIELSDVVLIANAAKFHPLQTLAAIEAGRHVFVEKPHGIDPAGIHVVRKAAALATEKRLSLVSGLQSRYDPGIAETVQRIHDGAIGDVIAIQEQWLRAPYGVTERRPGLTELEWQCSTQYRFVWLSGDDVVQSLTHNLDRSRWVLHEQVPLKCHGLGGRSSMIGPIYGDVFDHHSVLYEFPNGVPVYAFCRTTTGCYDEDSSIVLGTKGRASVKARRIWGQTNWRWQGQADPYQIEHDQLFASIRSGRPLNNGSYMADSTLMCIMGQISCYTGQQFTWDQVSQSNFLYPPKPEDCHDSMEPPTRPGPDGAYPVFIPGRTRLI
jgi:myo-inositol 2-dehydrogenase / D-chiro-inositol 1-dehydrogenase